MTDRLNVLLVGGGGREHALATRLKVSPRLGDLWVTNPENPGLASMGKPIDVPVSIREIYRLQQFIQKNAIQLVVIGPEDPLAEGFADKLASPTTMVFGPVKDAAQLEANKAWAKHIMKAASVPTAEARVFSDYAAASAYLESRDPPPVVKAAGLAKGKGVIVPESKAEAMAALKRIMVDREFGEAGSTVVLEERLKGLEASVLALVDGRNILTLPVCQDHKRLGDGDTGPNTGGMGAFCPSSIVDERTLSEIEAEVLVPTVDALRREGIEFRGVLYAGLMLTAGGPRVLEFNTRFGDPECQPLISRLKTDLLELLVATCTGRLDEVDVQWDPRPACCIVLASPGYPEKPVLGATITGVEEASRVPDVRVDHAGTRLVDGKLVTGGGRVLCVTALGETMSKARDRAYEACEFIQFEGKTYRRDIGSAFTG